jgi:hypothetical protein
MPDHGCGRCDGHHEMIDLRFRKAGPAFSYGRLRELAFNDGGYPRRGVGLTERKSDSDNSGPDAATTSHWLCPQEGPI